MARWIRSPGLAVSGCPFTSCVRTLLLLPAIQRPFCLSANTRESKMRPPIDSTVMTPPPRCSKVGSATQASRVLAVRVAEIGAVSAKASFPSRMRRPFLMTAAPFGWASSLPTRSRPSCSKVHQWLGTGPAFCSALSRRRNSSAESSLSILVSLSARPTRSLEKARIRSSAAGRSLAWRIQRVESSERIACLSSVSRSRCLSSTSGESTVTWPGRLDAKMP